MKISKTNLLAFVRSHTYGEEIIKGCRSKESANFRFVEFMFGETVGEIRVCETKKDMVHKIIIPIFFISDDSSSVFDNIEEFNTFINIFFTVKDYDTDTKLPLALSDYYENTIRLDYMYFETTLHTYVHLKYGITTERFLINGHICNKEKNHGETENV